MSTDGKLRTHFRGPKAPLTHKAHCCACGAYAAIRVGSDWECVRCHQLERAMWTEAKRTAAEQGGFARMKNNNKRKTVPKANMITYRKQQKKSLAEWRPTPADWKRLIQWGKEKGLLRHGSGLSAEAALQCARREREKEKKAARETLLA